MSATFHDSITGFLFTASAGSEVVLITSIVSLIP